MNAPLTPAQVAQQRNRSGGGRYATKPQSESGISDLDNDATPRVALSPVPYDLGISKETERLAIYRGVADALRHTQVEQRHGGADDYVVYFSGRDREHARATRMSQMRAQAPVTVVAIVTGDGIQSHDPRLAGAVFFDKNGEAFCNPHAPTILRCWHPTCNRVRHYGEYNCTSRTQP